MGRRIGIVGVGLLTVACGGRFEQTVDGVARPTGASCATNPNGVCYPTEDIGTGVRSGAVPGSRMTNLAFVGFKARTVMQPLDASTTESVTLADYYDPDGSLGSSIIVILENGMWCPPSNTEADFFSGADYTSENTGSASWARELAPLGVVVIETLFQGPQFGVAATLDDLRTWVTRHNNDYTTVLDGELSLGALWQKAEFPVQIVLDARSMEILEVTTAFETAYDTHLKTWVDWTKTNPPRP